MKQKKQVKFIRRNGRVIPITVGVAATGIAANEITRRKTLVKRGSLVIKSKKSIFRTRQSITGFRNGKKETFIGFAFKKKNRVRLDMIASVNTKTTVPTYAAFLKEIKKKNTKTVFGHMASHDSINLIKAKKGKFLKKGIKGNSLVGSRSAKINVTKLLKRNAKSVVLGVLKVK